MTSRNMAALFAAGFFGFILGTAPAVRGAAGDISAALDAKAGVIRVQIVNNSAAHPLYVVSAGAPAPKPDGVRFTLEGDNAATGGFGPGAHGEPKFELHAVSAPAQPTSPNAVCTLRISKDPNASPTLNIHAGETVTDLHIPVDEYQKDGPRPYTSNCPLTLIGAE